MTREERELSIEYLEKIKEDYIDCYGDEKCPLPEYYAIDSAIKALKQEPCEDAVSRKAVITIIYNNWWNSRDMEKLVRKLPPVTPQEPKPMVEIDLYSVIKQKYIEREVLDKIRAEIKAMFPPSGSWMYEEGHEVENAVCEVLADVLRTIDKYKAESEG